MTLPCSVAVGEIIAWRFWIVDVEHELLGAVALTLNWWPGEVMDHLMAARVMEMLGQRLSTDHAGVYAYKTEAKARAMKFAMSIANPDKVFCHGSVELWGDVIDCEQGYRAQFADVRSLDSVSSSFMRLGKRPVDERRLLSALRDKYLPKGGAAARP